MYDISSFIPRATLTDLVPRSTKGQFSVVAKENNQSELLIFDIGELSQDHLAYPLDIARRYQGTIGGFQWSLNGDFGLYVDTSGDLRRFEEGKEQEIILRSGEVTSISRVVDSNQFIATLDNRRLALLHSSEPGHGYRVIFGGGRPANPDHFIGDETSSSSWGVTAFRHWYDTTMPWYESRIIFVNDKGEVIGMLDRPNTLYSQPRFSPDGKRLAFISSATSRLSIYLMESPSATPRRITWSDHDYGDVDLGFGQASFSWSQDSRCIYACRNENGFARLVEISIDEEKEPREIAKGFLDSPIHLENTLISIRSGAKTPTQVVAIETTKGTSPDELKKIPLFFAHSRDIQKSKLTEPELHILQVKEADELVINARITRSSSANTIGTIVALHGGPIGQHHVRFDFRHAFYNSIGFDVVTLDPRGTSGYGIDFIKALNDGFGDFDVDDVTMGITKLIETNKISLPIALMGGSAGGLVALRVATAATLPIKGVIALYPVVDLKALSKTTHRFERNFLNIIVGDPIKDEEIYLKRSPINETKELKVPVLLLQGDQDTVVDADTTIEYAKRLRMHNKNTSLCIFAGEGHGFNQETTIKNETKEIVNFLFEQCGFSNPMDHDLNVN